MVTIELESIGAYQQEVRAAAGCAIVPGVPCESPEEPTRSPGEWWGQSADPWYLRPLCSDDFEEEEGEDGDFFDDEDDDFEEEFEDDFEEDEEFDEEEEEDL